MELPRRKEQGQRQCFNYATGDYVGMRGYLLSFNWGAIIEVPDVNEQVKQLTIVVQDEINKFMPMKGVSPSNFLHWFCLDLRTALRSKYCLHRTFKKTGHPEFKYEFRDVRSLCRRLLKRDRLADTEEMESHLRRNLKQFWNCVKSRQVDYTRGNTIVFDEIKSCTMDVCNIFARNFRLVYATHNGEHVSQALLYANGSSVPGIVIE